jgi:dephospho-CoA kinase
MLKVGITGGIGSGKSYVCKVFRMIGVPVFHADKVAQDLLDTHPLLKHTMQDLFGANIYVNDRLNRKKVAEIVFQDKTILEKLNQVVHPLVLESFNNWTKNNSGHPYVLKEAAIIFESGAEQFLDAVINITAPRELRIIRVMKRDKVLRNHVIARMENQLPEEDKLKRADYVIYNDEHSLILPQIINIHNKLQYMAKRI